MSHVEEQETFGTTWKSRRICDRIENRLNSERYNLFETLVIMENVRMHLERLLLPPGAPAGDEDLRASAVALELISLEWSRDSESRAPTQSTTLSGLLYRTVPGPGDPLAQLEKKRGKHARMAVVAVALYRELWT